MLKSKLAALLTLLKAIEQQMGGIKPIYPSAFEVLIFCIISLRTKDEVAYPAADRLFMLGNTPLSISKLDKASIAQAIYPAGFYQRKAQQILAIAQDLATKGLSEPPNTAQELLAYQGVGLKTVNLTLSRGFNLPAICVDIHVHRIANRFNLIKTDTPDQSEAALRQIIPQHYWSKINPLLVYLGQQYCGVKPKCHCCLFTKYCLLTPAERGGG